MVFAFSVFILTAWSVMFFMHWVIYNSISRVFDFSLQYWFLVLGTLSATYLLASVGVRTIQSVVADWFYFVAATWLGVVFLVFSIVVLYELVHVFTSNESKYVLTALLTVALLLSLYAVLQGRSIVTKEYTLPVQGLEKSVRIVHLSDIHVGTVHQTAFLERVVAKTNELEPDMVLVTGDMFDGSAPLDERMLAPLNKLTSKSFFSTGNHEVYEGLEHVREIFTHLDMILLENEISEYKGVEIVAVEDRQALPKGESLETVLRTLPLSDGKPSVLMYHTPVDWDVARKYGVDVTLSGHTHNGQIFPFTLLVKAFFPYIQGVYEEEGKYLHVSPGTGTWGPPMRLGSHNQITLLTLEPAL